MEVSKTFFLSESPTLRYRIHSKHFFRNSAKKFWRFISRTLWKVSRYGVFLVSIWTLFTQWEELSIVVFCIFFSAIYFSSEQDLRWDVSVCTPPFSAGGGIEPPTKFSKVGLERISIFRGEFFGKRGWLKKQTKIWNI